MRRQNPQQQQTTDNTAQANAPLTGGQNYNSVPVNQTVAPLQTNQSPVMKQVRFFQPSMKTQELKELIRQRIIKQMPLLKHYPDMPVIEDFIIQTFDELAYKMSDQQDFIVEQLEEIMTKFHGHYMTKLCKQLKEENKNLQDQVDSTHPPQLQQTQNVAQEEEKSQQNSDTSNPFAKKKQDAIQNGVDKINQELESEVFQKDEDIYQAHQKIKLLEQLVQDKTKIEEDLRRKLQFAEEDHSKIKQSLGTMVMKSQLEFIKKSKIDLEKQVKSLTLEKQSHDMEIQRMKNDMMKLQNLLNQQQQAQNTRNQNQEQSVQFASVSHGIFICEDCSQYHLQLGEQFTTVRPIASDFWSPQQIEILKFGGNEKFRQFLGSYEIAEFAIQEKYRTLATKYYSMKLECLSKHQTPNLEAPSIDEGKAFISSDEESKSIRFNYLVQVGQFNPLTFYKT